MLLAVFAILFVIVGVGAVILLSAQLSKKDKLITLEKRRYGKLKSEYEKHILTYAKTPDREAADWIRSEATRIIANRKT